MKIVHLCLGCFFPDNYSYQENMLPKYHKYLGYEVEVISSLQSFDKNGNICFLSPQKPYLNENDILVTRLNYKKPTFFYKKMKRFIGLYTVLEASKPDILFIHGCQFLDVSIVVKYLDKHRNVVTYVDNHADFSNSARNWFSKIVLHKIIWKKCAKMLLNYTKLFYGVLPARVEFLIKMYNIPTEKVQLLVMGADDIKVNEALNKKNIKAIREKYNIKNSDFLLITGGKIDTAKKQILYLMQAVKELANPNVKLIVFGSIIPELKNEIKRLCNDNIQYIGWIDSDNTYNLFACAELVIFPGRHSVFWEQVVALGRPLVCKLWPGTQHIDIGGNVVFIANDGVEELKNILKEIIENPEKYKYMLNIAMGSKKNMFLYSSIAKQSIHS